MPVAARKMWGGTNGWRFRVTRHKRRKHSLKLISIRGWQDQTTVLRHAPRGRELIGLNAEPRCHLVDRRPSAKGLGDNLCLHLIRPAPLPEGVNIHTKRSEKRIHSTHCETHALPRDGNGLARAAPAWKVGTRRRLYQPCSQLWAQARVCHAALSAAECDDGTTDPVAERAMSPSSPLRKPGPCEPRHLRLDSVLQPQTPASGPCHVHAERDIQICSLT